MTAVFQVFFDNFRNNLLLVRSKKPQTLQHYGAISESFFRRKNGFQGVGPPGSRLIWEQKEPTNLCKQAERYHPSQPPGRKSELGKKTFYVECYIIFLHV